MDQQPGACTAATRGAAAPPHALSRPVRWLFVALGVISVGFAVVGAIVPGMPTTVFLIVASYCFTRSCPWLEERLLGHRLFAPYLPFVRQGAPMPRRARVVAIAAMWVSISVSLVAVNRAGWLSPAFGAGMVGAGAVGTIVILLVRRGPSPAGAARAAVGGSSPERASS